MDRGEDRQKRSTLRNYQQYVESLTAEFEDRVICDSVLTLWLSRLPEADVDAFVFTTHQIGFAGDARGPLIYSVDFQCPMKEWKSAWYTALPQARLKYRWHDLHHTFITRLLENPNNSEETVRALAGHVSRKMIEHYSHIRQKAKETAIAGLENSDSLVRGFDGLGRKLGAIEARSRG